MERTADSRALAATLVEQIEDAVQRRFNRRRGCLVPSRLHGALPVANPADGEVVMDHADSLLEDVIAGWPEELDLDVYLDLLQRDGRWSIEWVVESGAESAADSDAEHRGEEE
ncbi:MAG: hypothetical protein KDC87_09270 [Planctomycetes bacterium]|nr:hypothetical protein [Planctomycetota bacterium]MCB9868538.1 hypothetical protein [Planctomycetota bacterium]